MRAAVRRQRTGRRGPNDRGLTYANPIATVLKRLAIELHKA